MSFSIRIFIIACCVTMCGGFVDQAYAYIDPGVGSCLFQIVTAGLMTALFVLSRFWHRIVALYCRVTTFFTRQAESREC